MHLPGQPFTRDRADRFSKLATSNLTLYTASKWAFGHTSHGVESVSLFSLRVNLPSRQYIRNTNFVGDQNTLTYPLT